MFKVLAYGATHVGRERKNNEDAFRIAPDAGVYLVCDGMGGHASGEIASQVAADTMVRFLAMDRFRPEFRWPTETLQHPYDEARALDAAVRAANREVFIQALANPAHKGMGTTIAGIHAGAQRLGIVHVGDSRVYRLRGDVFEQLTEDHSLLNYYLQSRPMSEQQIKEFAAKNVIIRAVGLRETVEPTVQVQDYRAGDIYLLCSDGLNDMVDDAEIERLVRTAPNRLAEASEALIEAALDGGGKDNVTVLMLQVLEMEDRSLRPDFSRRTMAMDAMEVDTSPGHPVPDLSDEESAMLEETTSPSIDITHDRMSGLRPFARTQPMPMRPVSTQTEAVVHAGELPADVDEATPPDGLEAPEMLRDQGGLGRQPDRALNNAASSLDWLDAPTLPLQDLATTTPTRPSEASVEWMDAPTLQAPPTEGQFAAADSLDWLDAATLPAAETRRIPSIRPQDQVFGPDDRGLPALDTSSVPATAAGRSLLDTDLDTDQALAAADDEAKR